MLKAKMYKTTTMSHKSLSFTPFTIIILFCSRKCENWRTNINKLFKNKFTVFNYRNSLIKIIQVNGENIYCSFSSDNITCTR